MNEGTKILQAYLSETQRRYKEAVESGDTETASILKERVASLERKMALHERFTRNV